MCTYIYIYIYIHFFFCYMHTDASIAWAERTPEWPQLVFPAPLISGDANSFDPGTHAAIGSKAHFCARTVHVNIGWNTKHVSKYDSMIKQY